MSPDGSKNTVTTDKSLNRRRTQGLHAGRAIDGVLDGARDQDFDLLRSKPRSFCLYSDLWWRKLRKHVVICAAEGIGAIGEKHAGKRHYDAAKADGEADQGTLRSASKPRIHFPSSPTWTCARNSSDSSSWVPRV